MICWEYVCVAQSNDYMRSIWLPLLSFATTEITSCIRVKETDANQHSKWTIMLSQATFTCALEPISSATGFSLIVQTFWNYSETYSQCFQSFNISFIQYFKQLMFHFKRKILDLKRQYTVEQIKQNLKSVNNSCACISKQIKQNMRFRKTSSYKESQLQSSVIKKERSVIYKS